MDHKNDYYSSNPSGDQIQQLGNPNSPSLSPPQIQRNSVSNDFGNLSNGKRPASAPSTTKKRTRPVSACETCRRKKVKCVLVEDQPICKSCSSAGIECLFRVDDLDPSLRADSRFAAFGIGENARKVAKKTKNHKNQKVKEEDHSQAGESRKGKGKPKSKGKAKGKQVESRDGDQDGETSTPTSTSNSTFTAQHSTTWRQIDPTSPPFHHHPYNYHDTHHRPEILSNQTWQSSSGSRDSSLQPFRQSLDQSHSSQPETSFKTPVIAVTPWDNNKNNPNFNFEHQTNPNTSSRLAHSEEERTTTSATASSSSPQFRNPPSLPSFRTTFNHLNPPRLSPPISIKHAYFPSSSSSSSSTSDQAHSRPHSSSGQQLSSSPNLDSTSNFNFTSSSSSTSSSAAKNSKLSGMIYSSNSDSKQQGGGDNINRSNAYHTIDSFPLPNTHNVLHKWYAYEKPKSISTFDNPGRVWEQSSSPLAMLKDSKGFSTTGLDMELRFNIGKLNLDRNTSNANTTTETNPNQDRHNASLRIYDERLRKREEIEMKLMLENNEKEVGKGLTNHEKAELDAASTLVSVKHFSKSPPQNIKDQLPSDSSSNPTSQLNHGSNDMISLQVLERGIIDWFDNHKSSKSSLNTFSNQNQDHRKDSDLDPERWDVFWMYCSEICPWISDWNQLKFNLRISSTLGIETKLLFSSITSLSLTLLQQSKDKLSSDELKNLEKSNQFIKGSLFNLLQSSSIKTIQTLFIYSLKEFLTSKLESQYLFIGLAWRMIKLLGLQNYPDLKNQMEKMNQDDKEKGKDEEIRRNWDLVRCVALVDKWSSNELGKSFDTDLSQLSQTL